MLTRLIGRLALALLCAAISTAAVAQVEALPAEPETRQTQVRIDLALMMEQAREAFRAGELAEAIALYQFILRFAPDFRPARVELSFALSALGERERAARLLRDLDTDGLDPEVIDTINRIVGPDRLNFFIVPEFFVDTNVTGQTKEKTVVIGGFPFNVSEGALGQRGYGYGLTFGASYRLRDQDPRTTLTGGLTIRDFAASKDDEQSVFTSLSMRFNLGERFALTPSVSAVYRYDDWQPREAEAGAGLAAAMALGPVRNTLGGRYRYLNGQREGGSRLDRDIYQIYDIVSFGFGGIAFRFDERYTYENWDHRDSEDKWAFESGIDVTFADMPWTIPTIGGSFTYTDFKNDFTPFTIERLDREWEGHVEFLLQDWEVFGSNPFLRYQYTESRSNIDLFDFDRHEVSIGIRAIVF